MKTPISIAFVTVILAGCATSPIPISQAKPLPADRYYGKATSGPSGKLIVTRDTGFVGGSCLMGFYLDGQLTGSFDTGEIAIFTTSPGEHVVGIGNPGGSGLCSIGAGYRRETSTIVKAGEVKYFRMTTRPGDGPALEPTTLPLTE